jgi:asparagine synthase (glutamine-hydrolysing)
VSVQVGMWNFDGQTVDRRLFSRFNESVREQGPDGNFCWINGEVALLYRPFHTTAESRREKQPYQSRREFLFMWDGRLDNRDELIADLRGDLEPESTDVAIVAAAFDRWETNSFSRIVGDWALSIWSPKQYELFLAIDYMAIRHIYYYLKSNRVWWSTDLTPLVLLSDETFHIDDDYIAGYFAHDPEAHLTPYREVREVPPGQFVRIYAGKASVERYWKFSPGSRIRYKTDTEYEEHFRHLFRRAVGCRLRSDSPILAELSGGLDSSSIVCMADDIMNKEGAQTPRVDTLSFYDKTEPNGDDWIYFPLVEQQRGRAGAHIDASKLGLSPAPLEYSDFAALPGYLGSGTWLAAERAAIMHDGGYRVVLSGTGGDEFMGGIPNPIAQLGDLIMQLKFVKLARQLMAWSLVKRKPWIQLLGQALVNLFPASIGQYLSKQAKVEPWIAADFANRTKMPIRLLDVDEHFGLWLPTRRSYIGGVFLMANKLAKWKSDVLVLDEYRYPYLDQKLIEFMLSIPAGQLLRPGQRRSLMRRALVGLVPQKILSRKTKQFGARTPVLAMDRSLDQLHDLFDAPLSANLGYIDRGRFLEKLHAAKNGQEIHISRMLRTVSLELWLRDLAARRLIDVPGIFPGRATPMSLEAIA